MQHRDQCGGAHSGARPLLTPEEIAALREFQRQKREEFARANPPRVYMGRAAVRKLGVDLARERDPVERMKLQQLRSRIGHHLVSRTLRRRAEVRAARPVRRSTRRRVARTATRAGDSGDGSGSDGPPRPARRAGGAP